MAKPSGQNSTGDGTPHVPISTGDNTPASVGDGTPQPPNDRPFACIFNPTDSDIIDLLQRKINNQPVIGDMVNKAYVYKVTPNLLVKRLHEYLVDGNPHYLVFTKTKVIEGISRKVRRHRKVGESLMGYWRPHGERAFITDKHKNVVGSKLRFTYDDGHLRQRDKGMQRSVWNMIEYQIIPKETDHRKYTICKIYMDPNSSHCQAFQEREDAKSLARKLRNEILTLEHRSGGWDHRGAKAMIEEDINDCVSTSRASFDYEQELVDKFNTSMAKKKKGGAHL